MLTLNWNLLWTFVNLIVLTLLLKKFLFAPVLKVMNQRDELIKKQLDDAKQKETEADKKLDDANAVINNAKQTAQEEANSLIEAVKAKNEASIAEAKEEAAKIMEESRAKAQMERSQLLADAREEMTTLALDAARKVAKVNVPEEMEEKLFADMLEKVGAQNEQ